MSSAHPFRFAVQVTELPFDGWRDRVRWYEQLGFSAIHWADHVMLRGWDPIAGEAAVAAATERAAVGTTVLDAGFYQPIVLARQAATIAAIAAGGYELGLGAGWSGDDYRAAGLDFDRAGARLARLDETLTAIRSLWTEETTTFEGEHVALQEAPSVLDLPLPVMPRLLVGATKPHALALAGRQADIVSMFPAIEGDKIGWEGWAAGATIGHYEEKVAIARSAAEAAGRDPDALELSTQITHTAVADDPTGPQAAVEEATGVAPADQDAAMIFLTGTPEQARERLTERRERTGVSYFVVQDTAHNYAHPEQAMRLPGDDRPGASDRYLEHLAETVLTPLA